MTIATKLGVASCNTAKAQGGIQAAVGDDDSVETHFGDITRAADRLLDGSVIGGARQRDRVRQVGR